MVNAPKKGWYLIHSDGRVINNPKDWKRVTRSHRIGLRGEWEEIWIVQEANNPDETGRTDKE